MGFEPQHRFLPAQGQIMSLYTLLSRKPDGATAVDIEQALAGNLCRCTGYRTILNAAKTFASDTNSVEKTIKGLCGAGAARLAASAGPTDPAQVDVNGGWYAPSELKTLCVAKVNAIGLRTPGLFRRMPSPCANALLVSAASPHSSNRCRRNCRRATAQRLAWPERRCRKKGRHRWHTFAFALYRLNPRVTWL